MKRLAIALPVLALMACGSDGAGDAPDEATAGTPVAEESDAPAEAVSPSFDCAKSDSAATDLVCETPMLARMDNELQRLYALAESGQYATTDRVRELKAMQRGWIKGRDDCWKAEDLRQCVTASYALRIHELRQGYFDARQEDASGISNGPLALACDGADYGISATFIQSDPGVVALQWLDNSLALVQVPSGSGAKYAGTWYGEEAALFTKGDEAMFTPPGASEMSCRFEEIG